MKPSSSRRKSPATLSRDAGYWLYGWHAVQAALQNPLRHCHELLVTANAASRLGETRQRISGTKLRVEAPELLNKILGADAVHQGIAARVESLPSPALEDVLASLEDNKPPLLLLDQISDPHNIGAILRSAAAFDAGAVIVPEHGSPPETAVMAKAASGALDIIPLLRVTNLSQAMSQIKEAGYWCVGLDGHTERSIADAGALPDAPLALALGAEGKGLRAKTREHCDLLLRLPISDKMESLNVSNAAAVALYALRQRG